MGLVKFYRDGAHRKFVGKNCYVDIFQELLKRFGAKNGGRQELLDGISLLMGDVLEKLSGSSFFDQDLRVVYRARTIGLTEGLEQIAQIKSIFTGKNELMPPPDELCGEGRFNYKGSPVFYGAHKIDVCYSEIVNRVPVVCISMGFKICEKLKILDLTRFFLDAGTYHHGCVDMLSSRKPETSEEIFIYHLNLWLGMPLGGDYASVSYEMRRIFADAIKRIGFDGFWFTSSVIYGKNIVLFKNEQGGFSLDSIDGPRCDVILEKSFIPEQDDRGEPAIDSLKGIYDSAYDFST